MVAIGIGSMFPFIRDTLTTLATTTTYTMSSSGCLKVGDRVLLCGTPACNSPSCLTITSVTTNVTTLVETFTLSSLATIGSGYIIKTADMRGFGLEFVASQTDKGNTLLSGVSIGTDGSLLVKGKQNLNCKTVVSGTYSGTVQATTYLKMAVDGVCYDYTQALLSPVPSTSIDNKTAVASSTAVVWRTPRDNPAINPPPLAAFVKNVNPLGDFSALDDCGRLALNVPPNVTAKLSCEKLFNLNLIWGVSGSKYTSQVDVGWRVPLLSDTLVVA
jgi:hypothetical protein